MKKVVRLGLVKPEHTQRGYNVYAKIEIKDGKLSISGVEGPHSSGHCRGGCGQIDMHPKPEIIELAKGWNVGMLKTFWRVWEKWHLNDMKAGCEHQELFGWNDYKKHPSEPCPICGYKYGSAWNKRELPQAIIDFLEWLPETDIKPSWV